MATHSLQYCCEKPAKIVNGYLFGAVLGEGSFARVKECVDTTTLVRYAVKIFREQRLRKIPDGLKSAQREMKLLQRLSHPNVVKVHDAFASAEKRKRYLVMDYCVCSLQEMLDATDDKRMFERQAHEYFTQLIDGLEYLHVNGVVHKDIKPGNLLLTCAEKLKIIDFGVAEEIDPPTCARRFVPGAAIDMVKSSYGTLIFQAPEIASGKHSRFRGFPVDVWATGVTLYYLTTGAYPFDEPSDAPMLVYKAIVNDPLKFPADAMLSEALQILHKKAKRRATIGDIRKHEWFKTPPPRLGARVPIPPSKKGGEMHELTVYESLQMLYE